jgi:hypothetical protein
MFDKFHTHTIFAFFIKQSQDRLVRGKTSNNLPLFRSKEILFMYNINDWSRIYLLMPNEKHLYL